MHNGLAGKLYLSFMFKKRKKTYGYARDYKFRTLCYAHSQFRFARDHARSSAQRMRILITIDATR